MERFELNQDYIEVVETLQDILNASGLWVKYFMFSGPNEAQIKMANEESFLGAVKYLKRKSLNDVRNISSDTSSHTLIVNFYES